MVPVSSSRIVTAQRPGTEAMISDIHRQSNVGTPTTARATTPPSGYEECAPVEMGMFTTGGAKEPARSCPRRSNIVDGRCREARMSRVGAEGKFKRNTVQGYFT